MSDDIKAIATRLVWGGDNRWDAADYAESVQREDDVTAACKWILDRLASDRPDDAVRYESELRRLSEFVQTRHPSGAVKHIGLMEAVPSAMELISEASEWIGRQVKPDDAIVPHGIEGAVIDVREDVPFANYSDDNEPITWWWWYGITRDDKRIDLPGIPVVLIMEVGLLLVLCVWNGATQAHTPLPHIRTRGDLRRLWVALTGKELGS